MMAAAVVAPIAYYPSYLQTGGRGVAGFWQQWRSLGNWPAGPAWFIWLLLAFDIFAAVLVLALPRWGESLGRLTSAAGRRPIVFFGLLAALSAVAYIPLAVAFNPLAWSVFGPFSFQTSRLLHYLVYFLLGAGVGACSLDRRLAGRRRQTGPSLAALDGLGSGCVCCGQRHRNRGDDGARRITTMGNRGRLRVRRIMCRLGLAFLALFVRFARKTRGRSSTASPKMRTECISFTTRS